MSIFSPPKHQKLIPFNIPAVTSPEMEFINTAIKRHPHQRALHPSVPIMARATALPQKCPPNTLLHRCPRPRRTHPGKPTPATSGASLVFVDIVPETMTISPTQVREAITDRTRVVVPVCYAGFACGMDEIPEIGRARDIYVVEDAALGLFSTYRDRAVGTMGQLGCISFQEEENTAGSLWGGSYAISELQAAYLWAQLEGAETIQFQRHRIWNLYWKELEGLETHGIIELPALPLGQEHNARIFWIKVRDMAERRESWDQ
ncbi:DegT/DnrJ/EryC1/StrS aminotransferase family protein [Aspergillus fischeri NRRL 181]|uniref:DegT/DnrJ/EryC1/StrS aminotransferase family protein n=1 Tax=Neosartorya fischeri (strain ATCC 1020 / DSM 3700 / CBS 544.65 / FGSC A1164 / JCM 1740 / NRRL 181 / WB 181) TaxID=331117 RepID=A1DAR7_NEOFI|nr:DegT/DnrJ/EryC1/StrS aminotransferase family protein [Aspergillus fischeri NRRL 181]EAW19957.1 DegT/DnrJ/EryC1/StrS aminotransferase family protein [Aspergillus fischeri NRRL 181]